MSQNTTDEQGQDGQLRRQGGREYVIRYQREDAFAVPEVTVEWGENARDAWARFAGREYDAGRHVRLAGIGHRIYP